MHLSTITTLPALATLTSATLNCSSYESGTLAGHTNQAAHWLVAKTPQECIPFCEQFPGIKNWWWDMWECDCFYEDPSVIYHIDGFYTGYCTEESSSSSSALPSISSSSVAASSSKPTWTTSASTSTSSVATKTPTPSGFNSTAPVHGKGKSLVKRGY
ncbi:hypothetical protein ASPWEDRAFT_37431 [Aspergillus wentii DTO 134E9]|uniref:Extracellular membrane protein CFEM domain-containing protein n=1 Tax=Aspergillus wentii DTO 134E9 TaxID=1073089 RepID=A0A1L9RXP6_ASPWE|nr:uncharacterized protein ASPWEDRAFT_37431 [Aspergillus wentii DTO 134E9]KAI9931705.1 hypothetical protein MW887_010284 [Aspergillus wentii]OJJ39618.1 hypothetical protein ASPWEDRAFT_37431 [Aspergillus wentii DTO 134E9]